MNPQRFNLDIALELPCNFSSNHDADDFSISTSFVGLMVVSETFIVCEYVSEVEGEDCTICVWDSHLLSARHLLQSKDDVSHMAINGDQLVVGHGCGAVRIWDLDQGVLEWTFFLHESNVSRVSIDDDYIAGLCASGIVHIWDRNTMAHVRTVTGCKERLLILHNRGRLMVAQGLDLHWIDVRTGELASTWRFESPIHMIRQCTDCIIVYSHESQAEVFYFILDTKGRQFSLIRKWDVEPVSEMKLDRLVYAPSDLGETPMMWTKNDKAVYLLNVHTQTLRIIDVPYSVMQAGCTQHFVVTAGSGQPPTVWIEKV